MKIVSNKQTVFSFPIRITPDYVTDSMGYTRHCGTNTLTERNAVRLRVMQFELLFLKVEIIDGGLSQAVLLDPRHTAECFPQMAVLQKLLFREEHVQPHSVQQEAANHIEAIEVPEPMLVLPKVSTSELSGANPLERFDSLMNLKYAGIIKRFGFASVDHKRFKKVSDFEEKRQEAHLNQQSGPQPIPIPNRVSVSRASSSADNGPQSNSHLFSSTQQVNNPSPAKRLPLSQSSPFQPARDRSCNLFDEHFPI